MDGKSGEDALNSFREEWQKEIQEIQKKGKSKQQKKHQESDHGETNRERLAEKLFLQGVENEENGRLYEAIQFYKKAVQLVPDVESKLYESFKLKQNKSDATNQTGGSGREKNFAGAGVKNQGKKGNKKQDLLLKLQNSLIRSGTVCTPKKEQKGTHISALPVEIIIYILRWVVSSDLDLRSLEMCSMVSRGFYVCSRDGEIWKSACTRIWGLNCGGEPTVGNVDWRRMYLSRPRLNFNGCYISKTTYVRNGENSFQDAFYRPWHVIEYYRYLRFFPEGKVVMLTTPDQPVNVVTLLKSFDDRHPSFLVGHYRLHGDRIVLALRRQDVSNANRHRSGKRNNRANDWTDQAFHIELQITSNKHRINNQLLWKYYSIVLNRGRTETKTDFEVSDNKFPPFWYSRVKSYTAESVEPLL